jgi:Flp pilus assembly CpaE family ATPase
METEEILVEPILLSSSQRSIISFKVRLTQMVLEIAPRRPLTKFIHQISNTSTEAVQFHET